MGMCLVDHSLAQFDLVDMAQQGKEYNGYKYILSVKDYFTKTAWFREIPDKSGMPANCYV